MISVAEITAMTPEQAQLRLAELAAVTPLLIAKAFQAPAAEPEDRLLDADAAAQILGVKAGTLYKNANAGHYPFTVRVGRRVLFSAAGIQHWLARRRAA